MVGAVIFNTEPLVPVRIIWSEKVPNWKTSVPPEIVSPAMLSVPTELTPLETAPGCKEAPEFNVTSPAIAPMLVLVVPPPESVAPELMVSVPVPTAEPEAFWRFNHPPLTVVPPV